MENYFLYFHSRSEMPSVWFYTDNQNHFKSLLDGGLRKQTKPLPTFSILMQPPALWEIIWKASLIHISGPFELTVGREVSRHQATALLTQNTGKFPYDSGSQPP